MNPAGRIGPNELASKLGAGGMGEVFRARDTRLNRDVAIEVLPPLFAEDEKRLAASSAGRRCSRSPMPLDALTTTSSRTASDGRSTTRPGRGRLSPLSIVLNWNAELKS